MALLVSATCPAPHATRRRIGIPALIDLWRQRQCLRHLDRAALEDIGISPREARKEAARPVWDVPATWRR